jgi:hypothetical protein
MALRRRGGGSPEESAELALLYKTKTGWNAYGRTGGVFH